MGPRPRTEARPAPLAAGRESKIGGVVLRMHIHTAEAEVDSAKQTLKAAEDKLADLLSQRRQPHSH